VTRPVAIVDSSAELGGAELSLLPVVRDLVETHRVVAFLPADGPLRKRLVDLGAGMATGFSLPGALAQASRQYGAGRLVPLGLSASLQQVRFFRALARLSPCALYCNGFRAQLGATMPAALLRVPVVWHVRDFISAGAPSRAWSLLARRATAIVANSSATATQPALPGGGLVIHNGIDLERFSPRPTEPPGPPVVGMVGHLTPWKGHLRFLRVLAATRQRMPELRGAIAGGPLYETYGHETYPARIQAELRDLGLEQTCSLAHVEPEAMPEFLSRLTVLVHCPDRPEPFGRSLVEAMALGVPVVAAAGDGSQEVVGATAVVCPLRDEDAVRDAVLELLADPTLRGEQARAGIARARALFDENEYGRRVANVIRQAAARRERATVR
jgi:glycosyltransferase involved in cell wall biosynthesis